MKTLIAALALGSGVLLAQAPPSGEQDAYTRIELMAPDTGTFKVTHELAVTTAGATSYDWRPWPGTELTSFKCIDLMTSQAFCTELRVLRGGAGGTSLQVVQIPLARPVPKDGQSRIRIQTDAKNPVMFRRTGQAATFKMAVSAPRGT